MAVLEKIRVKLGVFITAIIAIALLSFIVDPSTLEMAMRSFSSKYDVGEIDGKAVSYQDYQAKVDYYTNIYSMTSGSQSPDEQALESIYQSAWQDFQNEILIMPMMKSAGINVGEDELIDLSQGQNLSPIIANEPAFLDQAGNFSRAQFLQFIQAIPTDETGKLAQYWAFLEKNMKNQQYFAKYMSLFAKSSILNPVELRRNVEENNTTYNAEFVIAPYGYQMDSTIKVTSSEIQKFYNDHKDAFKQQASRDVEFVAYEVVPSAKDFEIAKDNIDKVFDKFATTDNLKNFITRNSDVPVNNYYYKKGELKASYPELDEFAFSAKAPKVLPVFKKDDQYLAARVMETKVMADSAFVQHILLPATNEAQADSIMTVLRKGANFEQLAAQFSLDKNPNVAKPGDIGWMTQRMMIPGMEDVLSMATGKYTKMTTNYGIHIVKVSEKTKAEKKVKLAILAKDVISSKETFQTYYAQANDLASRSEGKLENFTKITDEEKLPVVPALNVLESAKKLSKYENTKEITRWIYKAKKGEVSPIITVDNKYFFVVALKEIREDGYASINSVKQQIEFELAHEKKMEKMTKEVAAKINGLTDMTAIAEALNTTVSTKSDIAFGSVGAQSFDPSLIGAVAGAQANKISQPVAGNVGVYVVNVLGKEVGSFFTDDDARMRRQQMLNYQLQTLPYIFAEMGDIKDNRARFY